MSEIKCPCQFRGTSLEGVICPICPASFQPKPAPVKPARSPAEVLPGETVLRNRDIVTYHKKLFPWMYKGNDNEWCEEQTHRLITLAEICDGDFLLKSQDAHTRSKIAKRLKEIIAGNCVSCGYERVTIKAENFHRLIERLEGKNVRD